MNKVIVVAVHPDDETLGAGGTLLKHKSVKDEIYWLIVTSALSSCGYSEEFIKTRASEIKAVSSAYGFKDVFELGLPAGFIDTVSMKVIVEKISSVFKKVSPQTVYLPFANDAHSDHRKVFEASMSCVKSFRHPYFKKILMMETISETEFAPAINGFNFTPNCFADISDFHFKKIEILKKYESELGKFPFPRSIENVEALSKYRGAAIGCKYAESFMILKEVM